MVAALRRARSKDRLARTTPVSGAHPGIEFINMLEGELEYRHGRNTCLLEPGDSLTFKDSIPHGPERLIKVPIRFLAIINCWPEGRGRGAAEKINLSPFL